MVNPADDTDVNWLYFFNERGQVVDVPVSSFRGEIQRGPGFFLDDPLPPPEWKKKIRWEKPRVWTTSRRPRAFKLPRGVWNPRMEIRPTPKVNLHLSEEDYSAPSAWWAMARVIWSTTPKPIRYRRIE